MPKKDDELEAKQPKKAPKAKSKTNDKVEPLVGLTVAQDIPKEVKSSKKNDEPETAKVDSTKEVKSDEPKTGKLEVSKDAVIPKEVKSEGPKKAQSVDRKFNISFGRKALAEKFTQFKSAIKKNRTIILRVGAGIVAAFMVLVMIFGVLIYGYQSDAPAVKAVAAVIPYPVERVGGGINFVSYSDYLFEVEANKKAIQNNAKLNDQAAIDFKSADGKKQIVEIKKHALDKLKQDELTDQLAHKYKVTVSSKEINDTVSQFYTRYGGKDTLLKTLKEYYGWDINDLKGVIYKQLLAKKLEEKIAADPTINAQIKAKTDEVAKKLKAGEDFATLAKSSSQASDASTGGDLGAFTKAQVPEEIQKAIAATPVGGISDPVKTEYGYEIIKVNSKDGDNYTASHILIKSVDYTTWFNEKLEKAKTNVYIVVK